MKMLAIILLVFMYTNVYAEENIFSYENNGKWDPFWPLVSPSGALINYDQDLSVSDMDLEGVMLEKDGRNVAIINGTIIKVNEKVGLFTVISINADGVVLKKGQEKTVSLKIKKED